MNSAACERIPPIVARINARNEEVVGHGRTNAERPGDLVSIR